MQVFDVVVGVDGEDVGFVEVVRRAVGVEGADAEQSFGGQVFDGDGFAGARVAAFVEGDGVAVVGVGEDGEVVEEGPDFAGAVAVDEVDAQAGAGAAELDGGGGVQDDSVRGRPGVDDGLDEPVFGWGRGYASATAAATTTETGRRRRRVIGGRVAATETGGGVAAVGVERRRPRPRQS